MSRIGTYMSLQYNRWKPGTLTAMAANDQFMYNANLEGNQPRSQQRQFEWLERSKQYVFAFQFSIHGELFLTSVCAVDGLGLILRNGKLEKYSGWDQWNGRSVGLYWHRCNKASQHGYQASRSS
jgi:hypothetical protein